MIDIKGQKSTDNAVTVSINYNTLVQHTYKLYTHSLCLNIPKFTLAFYGFINTNKKVFKFINYTPKTKQTVSIVTSIFI